jgi:transcription elongation factor Elf1
MYIEVMSVYLYAYVPYGAEWEDIVYFLNENDAYHHMMRKVLSTLLTRLQQSFDAFYNCTDCNDGRIEVYVKHSDASTPFMVHTKSCYLRSDVDVKNFVMCVANVTVDECLDNKHNEMLQNTLTQLLKNNSCMYNACIRVMN